jgi:glycosyltransferase involved in cell wall biosynthesis
MSLRPPAPRPSGGPVSQAGAVLIVGSGTRFVSGISYYTHKLAVALSAQRTVGVVLMRKLIPQALYPGRERVGARLTELTYPAGVPVVDGVDWYGGLGLLRAVALITRLRPATVVLQWWTGAVLHTYIILALYSRMLGAQIIIEFHEVQDTGETKLLGAARYVRTFSGRLMALASAAVVHSESDVEPIRRGYRFENRPVAVIPHGPFDQYTGGHPVREAPADAFNLLFFGTIRPYKGLEDLILAFNSLAPNEANAMWLTVVGETWEGWTQPAELIAQSPYRDRISFVNRYLTDAELAGHLAGADAVALPYRRSSASGPLHVTMAEGLPVIVTSVGGLEEAGRGYGGAVWVPPGDPAAIRRAFARVRALAGTRHVDPQSWESTAGRYGELFAILSGAEG